MKTSVIEVRDMLSVLSVAGVEKRIGNVGGVESVTVNYAAGNATVRYDETRLDIADIKADVRQSGYDDDGAPPGGSATHGHETRAAPSSTSDAAHKMTPVPNDVASAGPSGSPSPDSSAPRAGSSASAKPSSPTSNAEPAGAPPAAGDTIAVPDATPHKNAPKGHGSNP